MREDETMGRKAGSGTWGLDLADMLDLNFASQAVQSSLRPKMWPPEVA